MRARCRLAKGLALTFTLGLLPGHLAGAGAAGTAAAAAGAASCPITIDCGPGCTGSLSSSFCVRIFEWDWRGGVDTPLGTMRLGPSVETACWLCECAYTYTDSNGNSRFTRTSELDCDASFGGVETTTSDKQ